MQEHELMMFKLMLVMLKWGSFDVTLQKHWNKFLVRTWVDGIWEKLKQEGMRWWIDNIRCKLGLWIVGLECIWNAMFLPKT
jgi:hypothetical protein